MGQRTRHFIALMKKNWIVWKRTIAASLCELFCPVALMAILAIARLLVSQSIIPAQSNIGKAYLIVPPTVMNAMMPTNDTSTQLFYKEFEAFGNFSSMNIQLLSPVLRFVTQQCVKLRREDAVPVIAYAGNQTYTLPIVNEIKKLFTLQQLSLKSSVSNPKQRAYLEAAGIDPDGLKMDYIYKSYDTAQQVVDYIASKQYMQNTENPGVCFGFSVTENNGNNQDISVKLIFNDHQQEANRQGIPSQLKDVYDLFSGSYDTGSFQKYSTYGYSYLQNWIANQVLKMQTGNPNATIVFTNVPFKSDGYIEDKFQMILQSMLPFFMLLMYILPVYRLISNIVSEKESKARESMKMMGLRDFSYWLSWWVYYSIVVTIISILCTIILSFNVFKYTNKGIIFLFFWIYGLSLFGLCIFLQSFFSKARIAAITGTLVYFGTSFVNVAVGDSSVKGGQKTIASLLTTVAVSLGSSNLGQFEISGVGLTMGNINTMYNNYRFSGCLIIMVISLILFFWIGIYLDNVLPSAYGLRKSWYFCCSPSYWFGSDPSKSQVHQRHGTHDVEQSMEQETFFEAKHMKLENFEPPTREMQKQEAEKKILKISDLKKIFDNKFQAVKGVNLKMYTGQIFALLGHNGAGKTTTISMLTGLLTATSGSAEVFGINMFEQMSTIRQQLGVCPQHDILFELLTPEEHLDIFCEFKGVARKDKAAEIKKMLIDVDIYQHRETIAKSLSGGCRRRLSVAIALIGGSKLVLLDEPTSGMDLSARRKLWNMLKNYKNNRIIILTTHYMDEADILGDRIGIMTGGQLICLGSSLFLKNRFGVGYNLTMVKKFKDTNLKIGSYLNTKLGEVKKLSEVSSEITYQIPNALANQFKTFFQDFDNDLDSLDIRSYGISVTTLEEVFLRVGHGDDTTDNLKVKDELKNTIALGDKNQEEFSIADHPEIGCCGIFIEHIKALMLKRFFIYRRNYKGLVIELLIPVLIVLIGLAFSKVQFFITAADKTLDPSLYPKPLRMVVNQNLYKTSANDIQPKALIESLPSYSAYFQTTYKDYSNVNTTGNGGLAVLTAYDNDVFDSRYDGSLEPYRYGSYYIYEANNATKQFKVANFLNITSQDVTGIFPQFMYEAILKQATGNPNFKFKVTTVPFPITEKIRQRAATANGIFICFDVAIGFALIPAAVISFILNEREKNLKHMQLISGMNLPAYWVSNLIFDVFKGIVPSAIVIGLLYAFEMNYDYVWILFLLYPLSVIPFTYVMSFLFASENVAQTITIFLHFVFAGIGSIVAVILRLIDSTYIAGDILVWVFKIIPSFCLTDSIMFQSTKTTLFLLRPELKKDDLDVDFIGGDILLMMVHFTFWLFILTLIESGAFKCFNGIFALLKKNKIPPKASLEEDEDVLEEEARVAKASTQQLKVRVHKFRKVYPALFRKPVLAVEKTSFGLEYGECFCLLGVNGAGKTTTFKSLTCETAPTSGQITIAGYDAQRQFNQARKLIGYCPQHDAIFELMTVEEHLEYYSRLKGIPSEQRKQMIEAQIRDMNLEEHRKKPAGTLSGGNKRKLSVAMSIIGNPPIVLLDEPSAGMDPEARRFMWSIVARISQQRKKSAVILTTHSMEEAEALSTKMGIMVKGGVFKCFGSSQHIKNKYGTGYEIEVKIRKLLPNELHVMTERFGFGTGDEMVKLDELSGIMRNKMVDEFLIDQIKVNGLGHDLLKEAEDYNGKVAHHNFLSWLYIEQCGMSIIDSLCEQFPSVEILEHYNDYFKLRVPRGDKSIGFVFGLIEDKKEEYKISEYSVSQTTLEQIFQTFANIQLDEDKPKFVFSKNNRASRGSIGHASGEHKHGHGEPHGREQQYSQRDDKPTTLKKSNSGDSQEAQDYKKQNSKKGRSEKNKMRYE